MGQAQKLFENPDAAEFGFAVNEHVPESFELTSHSENLRIRISPNETNLSVSRFDTVEKFKSLIGKFCELTSAVYSGNQFNFSGIVFRLQGKLSEQSILDLFPTQDHSFAHSFSHVTRCHTTYRENGYRVHVILLANENTRADFTLDFDTQKVENVKFADSPAIVDECYQRLKSFIEKNSEGKGE